MSVFDDWDKIEDRYVESGACNLSKDSFSFTPEPVVEIGRHWYLPEVLLKALPTIDISGGRYQKHGMSKKSDKISMVLHGNTLPKIGLYGWTTGLFSGQQGLLISSAGSTSYTSKDIQILAFNVGLLSLKRPCYIDLIARLLYFGTTVLNNKLVPTDRSMPELIYSWCLANSINKAATPWNSYNQQIYDITSQKTKKTVEQYEREYPTQDLVVSERYEIS